MAIEEGNVDIATLLIEGKADVNIQFDSGSNPLQMAIEEDCLEITRELIKAGAVVNAPEGENVSILHLAIEKGNADIVRELIQGGAVVNAKDGRGSSLLHFAIKEGNIEIVRVLIDSGAHVNITGDRDLRDIARREGSYIHTAVTLGYDDIIRYLLSCEGIDVNARNLFGQTLLHCAMQIGNGAIVDDLLAVDCDLTVVDEKEKSVLHIAAIYGHCDIVEMLLKKGMESNKTDSYGRNSLYYGVQYRNDDVVKVLRRGFDFSDGIPLTNLLHNCEVDCLTARVLRSEPLPTTVHLMKADQYLRTEACSSHNLATIKNHPGIGSIKNIYPEGFDTNAFADQVKRAVERIINDALPEGSGVTVVGCGSSFEGSKVGLPDELDFLIELFAVSYNFSDR
jgi:ankyrin repeat protein